VWPRSIDFRSLPREGSKDLQGSLLPAGRPSFFSSGLRKFAILPLNSCTRSFDLQVVELNWMLSRTAQDDDTELVVLWMKACRKSQTPGALPSSLRPWCASTVTCLPYLAVEGPKLKANLYPTSFHQQIHRPRSERRVLEAKSPQHVKRFW
jgi:hypothetical protein